MGVKLNKKGRAQRGLSSIKNSTKNTTGNPKSLYFSCENHQHKTPPNSDKFITPPPSSQYTEICEADSISRWNKVFLEFWKSGCALWSPRSGPGRPDALSTPRMAAGERAKLQTFPCLPASVVLPVVYRAWNRFPGVGGAKNPVCGVVWGK